MGQEQWFLIPKDGISLLKIRSKIERQGVRKNPRRTHLRGFFFYQDLKFGHFWSPFAKW